MNATSRPPFRGAFLLPTAVLLYAGSVGLDEEVTGRPLFFVALAGVLAGALWQFLHRRDLVDRLTFFASAFTVTALSILVAGWSSTVTSTLGLGVGLGAVLTGCVYMEQWLRSRDARRAVRSGKGRDAPCEPGQPR